MNHSYKYIFRFCCDPGFNDKEELQSLERFVGEACIDDVAVFANVEEMNTGHMSFEEQDVFIALMQSVKAMMAGKGITMSVNQWHSIMHADIGKALREGQNFRTMVDVQGNKSALCVCPLCENWQNYIAKLYARYAELSPTMLWVEDDFRLHNHEPLVWGGCFCEEHMRIYSERAGKPLTRDEFIEGLLQKGEVHKYRKIWLDVAAETMLCAASAIGKAVREVNSSTKVSLMCSVPHIHAAEGRRWHDLVGTLSQGLNGVVRIHLPGYCEVSPKEYIKNFNMVSMMTKAMLPQSCEVYPELENFPYSRYAKSRKFTRFQLLSSLALGLEGITIDLYDLNGNGIVWSEGYQDMLRDTKPYLNHLSESGIFKAKRLGVQVMYSERSAYTLQTKGSGAMENLYPHESFWAGLLPSMGVPMVYSSNPEIKNEIVAISGQYLRNLSQEQIASLFENNFVMLNGDAAYTLYSLGLGHLAGIKSLHWQKQGNGSYTLEQITNGKSYCGVKTARASAVISCSDVIFAEYEPNIAEISAFYDSYRTRSAPAEVVFQNKVFVYPFGNFNDPLDIPAMLLNTMRAEILHEVINCAGAQFPLIENSPYLVPYCFENDSKQYLYLVNAATDDVSAANISVAQRSFKSIYRSNSLQYTSLYHQNNNYALNIPSMEAAMLCVDAEVLL